MNKSISILAIIFALAFNSICAQRTIIANNQTFDIESIDKITFDNTTTPAKQYIWQGNKVIEVDLVDNLTMPFFNGLNVFDCIYEANETDDVWIKQYITPIGFFYCSSYSTFIDDEENGLNDKTVWYYQSFDNLKWAMFITAEGKPYIESILYESGEVDNWFNESTIEIFHSKSDHYRETEVNVSIEELSCPKDIDDIHRFAFYVSEQFNAYTYESYENELREIIESIRSLMSNFTLPVNSANNQVNQGLHASGSSANQNAKIKIDPFHFTIYPITGGVKNVSDTYAEQIEGAIRAGGISTYLNNNEYGILIDTNPDNLVVGKSTFKRPCEQERLSLSFFTDVSGLKANTKYYYRTYATLNSADKETYSFKYQYEGKSQAYGKVKSFKTDATTEPDDPSNKEANLTPQFTISFVAIDGQPRVDYTTTSLENVQISSRNDSVKITKIVRPNSNGGYVMYDTNWHDSVNFTMHANTTKSDNGDLIIEITDILLNALYGYSDCDICYAIRDPNKSGYNEYIYIDLYTSNASPLYEHCIFSRNIEDFTPITLTLKPGKNTNISYSAYFDKTTKVGKFCDGLYDPASNHYNHSIYKHTVLPRERTDGHKQVSINIRYDLVEK